MKNKTGTNEEKIVEIVNNFCKGNYNFSGVANDEYATPVFRSLKKLGNSLKKNKNKHASTAEENLNKLYHYLKLLIRIRAEGYENFSQLFQSYIKTGCELLSLPYGLLYQVNGHTATNLAGVIPGEDVDIGRSFDLRETYLQQAVNEPHPKSFTLNDNDRRHPLLPDIKSCVIAPVFVENQLYAILEFAGSEAASIDFEGFSKELIDLIAQDIGITATELMHRQERNKVESALLASKEQFRFLVDNIAGAVYRLAVDSSEEFQFMSAEIEEITGRPASYFDNLDRYYEIVHPEDLIWLRPLIDEAIANRSSLNVEYRLHHLDGSIRWVVERGAVVESHKRNEWFLDGVIFDNTQSKLTEQALSKSENRYKLVTSYEKIAIWDFNVADNEHYISDNLKKMLEYGNEDVPDDFNSYIALTHPEDIEIIHNHIYKDTNSKVYIFDFSTRKLTKNGTPKWMHTRGTVIKNEAGDMVRIAGLDIDITEQKQVEEALQHSEERYLLATSSGSIGVWDFNYDSEEHYVSQNLKTMLGYKSHELQDSPEAVMALIHPHDIEKVKKAIRDHFRGTRSMFESEYRMAHKNGAFKWILSRGTAFRNEEGWVYRMAGANTDITDKKLAELEAHETRNQLKYLFDNLDNVFISYDAVKGRYIHISPSIERILGFTADEFSKMNWLDTIHPDDRQTTSLELARLWNGEKLVIEHRVINKKKEAIWISADIKPMMKDGKVMRFDSIFTDITERKKQDELIQAKELAENSLKFKSEFLANMSHEIRTPMNGIIGMTDLLLDTNPTSRQLDYIKTIHKSSKNLLAIINDILDLSKLEAGKMKVNANIFNFHDLVKQVKELFVPVIKDNQVEFKTHIDKQVPEFIKGDETKISQVLTNLVSNAAKFTEQGEISVSVSLLTDDIIQVEVRDTGIGIRKEDMNQLFQQFTQLNTPTKKKYTGTGLGLTICQRFAELMGGRISVRSERYNGSVFGFTFKFEEASEMSNLDKYVNKPPEKHTNFNAKVLLVEDNPVNKQVTSLMLKKYGCEADLAGNGLEALSKIGKNQYDLILMDIQMPLMDGIEATKIIKEKYDHVPPIIGLSANAMEGDAEKYKREGMDDYVAKPITSEQLLVKLRQWLTGDNLRGAAKPKINKPVQPVQDVEVMNIKTFNDIKDIAGENGLKEIYDSFMQDATALIADSEKAMKENDNNQLYKSIHTLKGLCGTVGASQLHELAKTINYQLNTSNYHNIDANVSVLSSYLNIFQDYFRNKI